MAAVAASASDGPASGMKKSQTLALLASVFVVAGCGLAYELTMSTAAAFFLGDTVLQFSLTIGLFLAALGLGAHLSRRINGDLLRAFVVIEIAIAAVGGASAGVIYLTFGWGHSVRGVTILAPLVVGVLVGLEIPLLARILARDGQWKDALSNVLSFDYLGGLAASLAYPLVLLPGVGVVRSALTFGCLNAATGLVTAVIFRKQSHSMRRLVPIAAVTLALLLVGLGAAGVLVGAVEKRLYGGELLATFRTPYQLVALSQRGEQVELHLDGHLQFASGDTARYHETMAHPAMGATDERSRVLIIGGGDGLLAREVLRWEGVDHVTLVDLDGELVEFCRTEPRIVALNGGALDDPRLERVYADGFVWLQETHAPFDRVFVDLPDPRTEGVARLFSVEMFKLIRTKLTPGGVISVQSTSPYYMPKVFWSVISSIEAAGYVVRPAHVNVPSLGEWGFAFGARQRLDYDKVELPPDLRFLTREVLPTLFVWPADLARPDGVIATRFDRPIVLHYYGSEVRRWGGASVAR